MKRHYRLYSRDEFERSGRKYYLTNDEEATTDNMAQAKIVTNPDWWEQYAGMIAESLPEDEQMSRDWQPKLPIKG